MATDKYVIVFERRGERANWKKAKDALKAAGITSMKAAVWDDEPAPSSFPMDPRNYGGKHYNDRKIYTIRVREADSELAYSIILKLFPNYEPYLRASFQGEDDAKLDERRRQQKIWTGLSLFVLAAMALIMLLFFAFHDPSTEQADVTWHYRTSQISNWPAVDALAEREPYTTFEAALTQGKIDKVFAEFGMDEYSQTMYYTLEGDDSHLYLTENPDSPDFKERLLTNGAEVYSKAEVFNEERAIVTIAPEVTQNFSVWELILSLVFMGLIAGALILIVRKAGRITRGDSPATGSGSSNEKNDAEPKTFDDIGGLHPLKADLKVVVDFLQHPDKYREAGADLPRGILLYGPPGTGKTLIAKVMANEAKAGFVYANASDFVEKYVGTGAARIRELFRNARKQTPCIVFIDEIDTLCSKRNSDMNAEDRKALTALLTEMDGFRKSDNILVIGATNRVEDMDEAALRPGRFSEIYAVPVPETTEDRLEIIDIYTKGKKFDETFNRKEFAEEMMGRSPAEIRDVLNEAAIISVERQLPAISKDCVEAAVFKRLMHGHQGDNRETDPRDLRLIAYHESGHALIARLCGSRVTKITILPSTSGAGGATFIQPADRKFYTKQMMENKVCEMYGGKVAEYLVSGKAWNKTTQGCSNDIQKATEIMKNMVDAFGMGDNGMVNLNMLSHETTAKSTQYITEMAHRLQDRTVQMMEDHYDILERLAQALLEKNTIYEEEINAIVGDAAGSAS